MPVSHLSERLYFAGGLPLLNGLQSIWGACGPEVLHSSTAHLPTSKQWYPGADARKEGTYVDRNTIILILLPLFIFPAGNGAITIGRRSILLRMDV